MKVETIITGLNLEGYAVGDLVRLEAGNRIETIAIELIETRGLPGPRFRAWHACPCCGFTTRYWR